MQQPTQVPKNTDLPSRLKAMQTAIEAFGLGKAILIADDGTRENEVDFVFAAEHATPALVNFGLEHCRGLVCVSVSPERANDLGIMSAPKIPAGFAHTGFTCSLDAREGISSGISAKDRAHTIALLANPHSTIRDFVSPGHVFPVTADNLGLTRRAGHTEAVLEMCRLSGRSEAGVMCEILGSDGEAMPVEALESLEAHSPFAGIPIVSTADILWCRLLLGDTLRQGQKSIRSFAGEHLRSALTTLSAEQSDDHWVSWSDIHDKSLAPFVLPYALHWRRGRQLIAPGRLRVEYAGIAGTSVMDNGISWEEADATISLFTPNGAQSKLPRKLSQFADLGDKEGLSTIPTSVKRCLTSFFLIDLLANAGSLINWGHETDTRAPRRRTCNTEVTTLTGTLLDALPSLDDRDFLRVILNQRLLLGGEMKACVNSD